MINGRIESEEETEMARRPIGRFIAHLDYHGEPNHDDDPEDYFIYAKGVRLA